ncbi:MAG: transcriptional repressor [Candidatus Neomarinimicrobiota bacterium]|nr:transcriptional repressor [Candidatus Neomarinimicrobiota bacterium]MEC7854659.1 transcriptional repressor [Candidatus Neomarinimicrobiota bacterium]|tara:strand:- start:3851 stop:4216 length:366 start_codon:yes stop_codon:yes gene_type:complete
MRFSIQKETIKKIVLNTHTHPTADWIYNESKKFIPRISLGTVYRNLKHLETEGIIKRIHDGNIVRYDCNTSLHDHLKCNVCGELIDIEKPEVDVSKTMMKNFNFNVTDVEMIISGTCQKHT